MSRSIKVRHNRDGVEAEQYGYVYLARRHGISCLEARTVLAAAGSSRERATYYANVLMALPMPPKGTPEARAEKFSAWAKEPLI